jgi:hypothetical protein
MFYLLIQKRNQASLFENFMNAHAIIELLGDEAQELAS